MCSALGLQATKALREQLRRYEKGASGRTDLLAVAAKRIQQWKAEEEHYVSQRETLIKKVEELNGENTTSQLKLRHGLFSEAKQCLNLIFGERCS